MRARKGFGKVFFDIFQGKGDFFEERMGKRANKAEEKKKSEFFGVVLARLDDGLGTAPRTTKQGILVGIGWFFWVLEQFD